MEADVRKLTQTKPAHGSGRARDCFPSPPHQNQQYETTYRTAPGHAHHDSCKITRRTPSAARSVSGTESSIARATSDPSIIPDPSASAPLLSSLHASPCSVRCPKCHSSSPRTHARMRASSLSLNTRRPSTHTSSGQHVERSGRGAGSCSASGTTCERRMTGGGEGGGQGGQRDDARTGARRGRAGNAEQGRGRGRLCAPRPRR